MTFTTQLRVKELLRKRGWTTKVLAEKTGMSESYLTHIKNGTRRWNEDCLRKIAMAFQLSPVDLLECTQNENGIVEYNEDKDSDLEKLKLQLKIVPIVGKIPLQPSDYKNQSIQVETGYKDKFIPIFSLDHEKAIFCLHLQDDSLSPNFIKGDYLMFTPDVWTGSGDIAVVEYGHDSKVVIVKINYKDDFIVLESINHTSEPVALVRGKDKFRVIGKLTQRIQIL